MVSKNRTFRIKLECTNLFVCAFLLICIDEGYLDVHLMLNHQEPKEQAQIVYKNDLAKNDLRMQFRTVKETLNNYNN